MKVTDRPPGDAAARRSRSARVLAFVLAGGEGTRLLPLTAGQCKPALPFAYGFRIVDFVLSNLVNSRIDTIYLLAQHKPESLIRHVESVWSPWTERPGASLRVLLPGAGAFRGTADAVYQNLELVERHRPDLVAVFAADHIYRMDVSQMVEFHRERNAEATIAAAPVPIREASSFGILLTAPDRRVRQMQEKPQNPVPIPSDPGRAYASTGNYLFEPGVLVEALERALASGGTDFGHHVLPAMAASRRVYAYDLHSNRIPGLLEREERGYWRDVGTLQALSEARQDVLGPKPRFNPWNDWWPIYGEPRPVPVTAVARLPRTRRARRIEPTPGLVQKPPLPAAPEQPSYTR